MDIVNCKTVEEVEALRCCECAKSGHYGWCDAPHIKCKYKDRIKEILGQKDCKYTISEHLNKLIKGQNNERNNNMYNALFY